MVGPAPGPVEHVVAVDEAGLAAGGEPTTPVPGLHGPTHAGGETGFGLKKPRLRSDGTLVVRSLEPGYRAVIRLSEAALLLGRNLCARYC
ncbi:MAG: hypothetical protein DLM54_09180 [Acidimicrobiales bacterium]|nr:MAG: hypothetical protein DLM54_09180 [Acidimicrobiales bacterium]